MPRFTPNNFMLLPTMACQAGCKYCFAKKSGEVMSRETADRAIDFISDIAPKGETIHLTFHGGEPLLAGEEFYAYILPRLFERFGRRVNLSIQTNLWAMSKPNLAGRASNALIKIYRGSPDAAVRDLIEAIPQKKYQPHTDAGGVFCHDDYPEVTFFLDD